MGEPTVETVAAKVDEAVASVDVAAFEPLCRRFAEEVYERLLHTVQDYLADNLTWNLRADFDFAAARARHYEQQIVEVDRLVTAFGGAEERLKRINVLLDIEKQHYAAKTQVRRPAA